MGYFDNTIIGNLDQVKKGVFLDKKKSEGRGQTWYDKLKFKAEGIHSPIMSLSEEISKSVDRQRNCLGAELII